MIRLIITPQESADVDRLEDWLTERGAHAAAERLGALLADALETLTEFPARGRRTPRPTIREIVVPFGSAAYLIQYRIDGDDVIVAQIRHSRERR